MPYMRGIEGLTFVVPSPEAFLGAFRSFLGEAPVRLTRQRLDIAVGADSMRFLSPERFARRYPGHPFGDEPPGPAVITFRVEDLKRVADALEGAPRLAVAGERIVRLPLYRGGPLLEFAES